MDQFKHPRWISKRIRIVHSEYTCFPESYYFSTSFGGSQPIDLIRVAGLPVPFSFSVGRCSVC